LDALLPILYLRGVSASDFQEALSVLLGKDAPLGHRAAERELSGRLRALATAGPVGPALRLCLG
jgi:hypothetical protein